MRAQTFYKAVTMDRSNLLERLLALLETHRIRYCVIGGQAVNAYVEPLVSLDLDVVIASDQLPALEALLVQSFTVKRFSHSLNISAPDSELRVQIRTDERYAGFVTRAQTRDVLGMPLKVAALADALQGKIWAAQDPQKRGSQRQKDLADIARLIEAHPHLRADVPQDILRLLL